ncbi:DNA end-binding protein Ku [Arboricoccus pini]|uniref:Non-homologous end joining protein Ku n=1 Tax=Arboricoccus pini TaxID=1963835 RepID=A0A212RJF9_9PROT|nr:Ku protein [Arboricoccus pini]SNB72426.1 DNA end-binding protein Ku [Arboricoccus pini]
MMPRANWKGQLQLNELSCEVALYTAISNADRLAFHILNRKTGHRVHRVFVDGETGQVVPSDHQVKGYETADERYVMLEPEEVAAAVPESDKTMRIKTFVAEDAVDDVYQDRPYYLAPATADAAEAYAVIRQGMAAKKVVALAQAVLFRRLRTLLIRPEAGGLVATTLNFDYEVRPASMAFKGIKKVTVKGEMLDLAKHIIETKLGRFDPAEFEDRYEAALAELVKAKQAGRPLPKGAPEAPSKVVDLMAALRESAGTKTSPNGKKTARAARRKAG